MSRILLADDSPHAQRMGERILREEGYEVVTVTDGETALVRLPDVDPDVVMADIFLPAKSGYDLCRFIKNEPRYKHTRVVLLAGLLEPVDEAEAQRVKADGILKKPFEASAMVSAVRPLASAAASDRGGDSKKSDASKRITGSILGLEILPRSAGTAPAIPSPPRAEPKPAVKLPDRPVAIQAAPAPGSKRMPAPDEIDAERVRAAVTVALDRAMPALIDEVTARVLAALKPR